MVGPPVGSGAVTDAAIAAVTTPETGEPGGPAARPNESTPSTRPTCSDGAACADGAARSVRSARWDGAATLAHRIAGRAAAAGRRALWRTALAFTGGLHVEGDLPDEPCVIVANHSSHADTAALLAALRSRRRPVVAAAADYWFGGTRRRWICRHLAAAFPVRRGGGGSDDLSGAGGALRAGRDVIVFPEGTRSRDGEVSRFHGGAQRLADRCGAPLVPVGIHGTAALLPVHGNAHRAVVTVRIGSAVPAIAQARESVIALAAAPEGRRTPPDSMWRRRAAAFAASGAGALTVLGWAFAESLAWPLLPEFALAVLAVAAPRRAPRLAVLAAVGSLLGGGVMYALAAHGIVPPSPLTTPRMHATAAAQIAREGAGALAHQPLSGIPYKVYGAAAGRAHVGLGTFLLHSTAARGLRILVVGLVLGGFGAAAYRWRRFYPAYVGLFVVLFTAALASILSYWSQP